MLSWLRGAVAVGAIALLIAHASTSGAQRLPPATGPMSIPLTGEWRLNLARTHYGPGVDLRRSERLSCSMEKRRVRCVIQSVRVNGQELIGRFAATLDGTGSPVTGIPGVDEVQLRRPSNALLDATFLWRGKPVFGYRALQSEDRRSLMIISVDPVSRVVLTTIVVYDRI